MMPLQGDPTCYFPEHRAICPKLGKWRPFRANSYNTGLQYDYTNSDRSANSRLYMLSRPISKSAQGEVKG